MAEEEDSHYLKSVTSLGDTREVVTNQDIYSKTGIKLASRGSRIDSSFYERLVRHKLMPQLDECMTIEGAVSAVELLSRAKPLLDGPLSGIAEFVETERIWAIISKVNLNNALSFKLTVASEKRPELFEHSLRIMLLSLYLGLRRDLPETELVALAEAALFHDLGELHIDPNILDKQHALTPDERKHIYAHPMTAYVILKNFPIYHPLVSTAVLEHHEYLDGSGYPAGLQGERISKLSQILAIAEVTGGIRNRATLEIALKLNKHKLDTHLIGFVSELFKQAPGESSADWSAKDILETLAHLAAAFEEWDRVRKDDTQVAQFADQRIQGLRQALFDAGFNPLEPDWLVSGIEDDPAGLMDVETLIKESVWQLKSLVRELDRLWPGSEGAKVKDWIGNCIQRVMN